MPTSAKCQLLFFSFISLNPTQTSSNDMNPKFLPLILLVILPLLQIPVCFCQDDHLYETCRDQRFHCGTINGDGIGYPFWGGARPASCGRPGFELKCDDDNTTQIQIDSLTYRVLEIHPHETTIRLSREDLWSDPCPQSFFDTTLTPNLFNLYSQANYRRVGLYYNCSFNQSPIPSAPFPNQFECQVNETPMWSFYRSPFTENSVPESGVTCNHIISTYVNQTAASALALLPPWPTGKIVLQEALKYGFWIQWNADDNCTRCERSGGMCGYNTDSNKFACHCTDGTYDFTCGGNRSRRGGNSKSKVGMNIGLSIAGAVLAGLGLAYLIMCCRKRRKQRNLPLAVQTSVDVSKDISTPPSSNPLSTPSSKFTASIPSYPSSNSELGRGSSYFGVQVFNYTELEQATDNFNPSKELGEGGFGTVYYGELPDGRVIAVKRLFENNYRRVEQFMNEVEILTQLRHPNLVTLHGCTSRRSRELLLVYEYIPNGTVADHVHGKRAKSGLLSWPVRLNIAIETAEALAYLHKSEIIHRDVKTNNILLDNNFHVKVADFGLSRLFPTDVTHVSTAPQGTPGYVDPEYHQCYQLTEKSDVYSFGVVLIELISSLLAVDTSRHRHDINLSNMAVTKIQNHALHEMVDPSLGFETNSAVRRRITLVAELAFRCLQQERDMRPSMAEVLESMKRIRDDSSNAHMVEVVDILVDEDETGPLKDGIVPPPPPEA